MSKWILIAIALIGLIYNVILMYRKMKEIRAMPETEFGVSGEELWHWVSDHSLRLRHTSRSVSQ